jgi:hypothetical protein
MELYGADRNTETRGDLVIAVATMRASEHRCRATEQYACLLGRANVEIAAMHRADRVRYPERFARREGGVEVGFVTILVDEIGPSYRDAEKKTWRRARDRYLLACEESTCERLSLRFRSRQDERCNVQR